jgi:hypothetical protein
VALDEVAVISFAAATIEMSQIAGDVDSPIWVSESFDMQRGSVLKRLTAQQPLTSLEIFVNLKPGVPAPELLSEHHAREAKELGRADASVVHVEFDPNAVIEKSVSSDCDWGLFNNEGTGAGMSIYSRKQRLDSVSGVRDLAVGTPPQTALFTTSNVTLGGCNFDSTSVKLELWGIAPGGSWQRWSSTTLKSGWFRGWYGIYGGVVEPVPCAPGLICPPQRTAVGYFIRANGTNPYSLRTAEVRRVPQPTL